MDFKYSGIIISKRDINEVDRLYVIYTREVGKISVLGKGVRRPNAKLAGNLETLTYSEIYISKGKGRGNITGAISLNNFLSLKSNFLALNRVFYALSFFNRFITQEEKDERVFDLFLNYLEIMNKLSVEEKAEIKFEIVTFGFLFKFLEHLGYGIEVEYCVNCGQKIVSGNNFFSAKRGGIICGNCIHGIGGLVRIKDASIKLLRIFFQNKLVNFSKLEIEKKDIDNLKIVFEEFVGWIK